MSTTHQFFAAAFSLAFVAGAARAQSEAGALDDVSALPVASVGLGGAIAAPGAVFVVKGVDASAYATVYALERVTDGARLSVEIAGRRAASTAIATGRVVTAKGTSTGIVLAADQQAIAFIPNALGRAWHTNLLAA
jgi:hypothetical protein